MREGEGVVPEVGTWGYRKPARSSRAISKGMGVGAEMESSRTD